MSPADLRISARSLAYLFGAGATLVVVTLLLPHAEMQGERGLMVSAAIAYGVTALLLVAPERLKPRTCHFVLALGTGLISAGTFFSRDAAGFAAFYVWVGVYAFYFFTRSQAALHVGLVALAYACVLTVAAAGDSPATRWLVTVGTTAVAGTLVARLIDEIRARGRQMASRAERLRELERRTRSILDTANEGFLSVDGKGVILDVNPRAEQLTGWRRDELVGRTVFSTVLPERLREQLWPELSVFRDGRGDLAGRTLELVALHRDGHRFPVEATVSSLRDGDGVVFNAFVRDISERKRAERHMREQIEDLEVVAGVARDLAGVTSAHAARPAICKAAAQLSDAALSVLYEPDRAGLELVSTAVFGAPDRDMHLSFAGPPSGATTTFTSGRPFFVAQVAGHPSVRQRMATELGVVSALWQPIMRSGVPIGVLCVGWSEPVERVTARVASLVALLAAEAAVAIERADLLGRLEAVARTDDLTGLANRRAWAEQLPREMARARRDAKPLCVAMLDLDRFKRFNDEYGHLAGDRLLKEVTAGWRETLRPSDLVARYGGEEFVLVLVNCRLDAALEVVERLRDLGVEGQTCSAGVAEWDGVESPESLVNRADHALYEAKKSGRDRVTAG